MATKTTKKSNVKKVRTVRAKKPATRKATTKKKPVAKKKTTTAKKPAQKATKRVDIFVAPDGTVLIR